MSKLLLSLLVLISLSQNIYAADKAFAVLLSYGFKTEDLVSVVSKFPELSNLDVSSESFQIPGEEFTTHLTLKLYAENTNDAYVISKDDKGIKIVKDDVHLYMEVKDFDGVINNTLYETILEETDSKKIATSMEETFKEDFSTTKGLRAQAFYHLQVEQYFDDGRFVRYGRILEANLKIGKAISKKILNINQVTSEWEMMPENFQSTDRPFYTPVKSSRVSSIFQLNRRHPITRRHQPHNGVDFVTPSGVPIFPALDGMVTTIARTRSKGKFITIQHDNGYITTYDHLKIFKKGLRVGDRVGLNDQIGEVGRTGFSTGSHLHFGIMKDGFYVNPLYLLRNYTFADKDEFETIDESEE